MVYGAEHIRKNQHTKVDGKKYFQYRRLQYTHCDASKSAYAAAVFISVEMDGLSLDGVSVQLLSAKTRVAPLKSITIPRLELLAAVVSVHLTAAVIEALNWEEIPVFY